MPNKFILIISFAVILASSINTFSQQVDSSSLDVISYQVSFEPDFSNESIDGTVEIVFKADNEEEVVFDCGSLEITEVTGSSVKKYVQTGNDLTVFLNISYPEHKISVSYHGMPGRGLIFLNEPKQAYTVFHTSEWIVCHDQPSDRAKISIDIIVPEDMDVVASGTLTGKKQLDDNKFCYSWEQQTATPPYVYGFAIGDFEQVKQSHRKLELNYFGTGYSKEEMSTIFQYTSDMIDFFEKKSGIPYFQSTYSQILIGNHYQEMSGFSVLKDSYGSLVLQDSTETNLISHELAHQWWGNLITCKDWGHFWLNEGFATFLSAAYNERRFGREKYLENISAYEEVYNKIKNKGADRSLVFEDWINPSGDDRSLVYFKGAFVLHKLREELGDEKFWRGIKDYTREYYGKSVVTEDFQRAMEGSCNEGLSAFFNEWVYLKGE